jgi:hypothetical protein
MLLDPLSATAAKPDKEYPALLSAMKQYVPGITKLRHIKISNSSSIGLRMFRVEQRKRKQLFL